jgi:hypothetical protein
MPGAAAGTANESKIFLRARTQWHSDKDYARL